MKYVLLILLFLSSVSLACSWIGDPTGGVPYEERVGEYIKKADYIFLGTIEEYDWKPNPRNHHGKPWHFHKIKINEQFKGSLEATIDYWPSTSCHIVFSNVGEQFVLFGYKTDGGIQFPMISGSILKSDAIEIGLIEKLRQLNKETSNKLLQPNAKASAE